MPLTPVVRDDASAAFFDAAASGRLVVQRCANGDYPGPPTRSGGPWLRCPVCGTTDIAWVEASGNATLVSWTIPHARDGSATGVGGLVELEEGPWMYAILDVAPGAELAAGQPFVVRFASSGDGGEIIPVFRPA